MRKPYIAGNWKMCKNTAETKSFLSEFLNFLSLKNYGEKVDLLIAPSFLSLLSALDECKNTSLKIASQNIHWEDTGAFTGEVSAPQLSEIGCQNTLIGHSERRQYFGETNKTVNTRLKAAINHQIAPIVCVGETLEEREAGNTKDIVRNQISEGFDGLTAKDFENCTIAYEPVWAIGTGKTATPEDAEEIHKYIRELVDSKYGSASSSSVRIQYGGSVKPDNIENLMAQPNIDGALIGGASLKVDSLSSIIEAVYKQTT